MLAERLEAGVAQTARRRSGSSARTAPAFRDALPGAEGIDAVPLGPGDYTALRQLKSTEEEVEWLRVGAALSDAGIAALADGLCSGLTEWQLGGLVERAYVPHGGTTHIHYFGVTPMADPGHKPTPLSTPPHVKSADR